MSLPNYDSEKGIYYGVISQHSLDPEAFSDLFYHTRDLSYERAVDECKNKLRNLETTDELLELLEDIFYKTRAQELFETTKDMIASDGNGQPVDALWSEIEQNFNDNYQNDEPDWLYEKDGYKLVRCLVTDVFVLQSPYFTYAPKCSPCVPDAGNLDDAIKNQDENYFKTRVIGDDRYKTYCLGPGFFEGDKAPYKIYSVDTGAEIQ